MSTLTALRGPKQLSYEELHEGLSHLEEPLRKVTALLEAAHAFGLYEVSGVDCSGLHAVIEAAEALVRDIDNERTRLCHATVLEDR